MLRAVSLVVALAACSKPTPESTLPPKATPQQCEQVADHLVGLMMKGLERNQAVNDTADRVRRVVNERCVQDGWGPDAHACFTRMQSMTEDKPCEEFLSIDQRNNIDQAIADAFDGPSATP